VFTTQPEQSTPHWKYLCIQRM